MYVINVYGAALLASPKNPVCVVLHCSLWLEWDRLAYRIPPSQSRICWVNAVCTSSGKIRSVFASNSRGCQRQDLFKTIVWTCSFKRNSPFCA